MMQPPGENGKRAHGCDSNCDTCDTKAPTKKKNIPKDAPLAPPPSSSIVFVDKPDSVEDLMLREEVQLVVWRRPVPNSVTTLADPRFDLSTLPSFVGFVTPYCCQTNSKQAGEFGSPWQGRHRTCQ
jgi:hypothetical protein